MRDLDQYFWVGDVIQLQTLRKGSLAGLDLVHKLYDYTKWGQICLQLFIFYLNRVAKSFKTPNHTCTLEV